MPKLICSHLSYSYQDGETLLDDVNLTVKTGEMIVIVGENGSGKSTLLKLMANVLTMQHGALEIQSQTESNQHPVAIVFQNPDEQMLSDTVENEITTGLEFRGMPRDLMSIILDNSLSRFDLLGFSDKNTGDLSGGQKQRVALAAITATNPSFLLLDEPDSMLDAVSRNEFLSAVHAVKENCGIIWTSPHPRKIPVADRYFLLEKSRLHETTFEKLQELQC